MNLPSDDVEISNNDDLGYVLVAYASTVPGSGAAWLTYGSGEEGDGGEG